MGPIDRAAMNGAAATRQGGEARGGGRYGTHSSDGSVMVRRVEGPTAGGPSAVRHHFRATSNPASSRRGDDH